MTQDTLNAVSYIKQVLATEVYPFVRDIDDDVVVQSLDVHRARRSKNWLKTSGLVTQGDLSYVAICAGCGVMRKARRGAKASGSADTQNWCIPRSVDVAVSALEKAGWDEQELIKYQQWSGYFNTACTKKPSVCEADEGSTICEWVNRNGDDYMSKDEWTGRTNPWCALRDRMESSWHALRELYDAMFCTMAVMCEDAGHAGTRGIVHCICAHFTSVDFKDGVKGYMPGASQSQGTAAARIIRYACGDVDGEALPSEDALLLENSMLRALHSADVDLDAVSQKLAEMSDVRIDLVAIECGVVACRRFFVDGMDALPTLPLAYHCRAKTLDILLARGMDWHSLPFSASAHNIVLDEMFSDTLQTVAITSDTFDACADTSKGNALNAVRTLWKRIGSNDNERAYRLLAACGRAFARSHMYVMRHGRADCAVGCAAIVYDCMGRRRRPTWASLEAVIGYGWHDEFQSWWNEYVIWAAVNSDLGGVDVATDLEAEGRLTGGDKWVMRGASRTSAAIQGQWRKPGVTARLHAELLSGEPGWGTRMDDCVDEFVLAAHANWDSGSGLDMGRWSGDIGVGVAVFAITKLVQA